MIQVYLQLYIFVIFILIAFYYLYKKIENYNSNLTLQLSDSTSLDQKQFKYLQQLITTNKIETIPIGSIFSFSSDTLPDNYAVCDGSALNISDYQELFSVIKTNFNHTDIDPNISFNLPDLRGLFIRGLDTSRTIGSIQNFATAMPTLPFTLSSDGSHTHTVSSAGAHTHSTTFNTAVQSGSSTQCLSLPNYNGQVSLPTTSAGAHIHTLSTDGFHSHTLSGGDSETRPNNLALVYIIKCK